MRLYPPLLLLGLLTAPLPAATPAAPQTDLNKIVNESYGFLKNREPEMTTVEYALYDKVVSLVITRPEYGMKLLETMAGDPKAMSPAFEFVLGNAHYAGGRHETAIKHYLSAVEKYPEFLRAWTNLGIAYYAAARYEEAAPCLMQAISLGDQAASTHGLLAYCQARTGHELGAEMAYLQACTLEPGNPDWVRGLVELFVGSKQYARAEGLARQLVRLRPAEGKHWALHASVLLALERRIDAIAVLETAARLRALDQEGALLLGDVYAQQGFHAEAVAAYEQILTTAPAAGLQRLISYAQSLIASNRLTDAQRILDRITPGPDKEQQIILLETRAALHFAAKEMARAQQSLEAVLQLEPLNGRALLGLGELYTLAGNATKARLIYDQAAQLPAFAYQANLELANLALNAKDYTRSSAHLRAALGLQPSPALQDYLARVTALIHEN